MAGKINAYYRLAKPGIVYGNTMHALAAGLFATAFTQYKPIALLGAIVGVALVIASACVVNCITDREIDKTMDRTKKRPLPSGEISVREATVYAVVLGIVGVAVLYFFTSIPALAYAILCHVTYTVVYAYVKRRSWVSTLVGTIPGALPVLVGYAAIDPRVPIEAWLLAAVILVWQLPHFYALALYRKDDYAKSGLPLLSVVKPRAIVVRHIMYTITLYAVVSGVSFITLPAQYMPAGAIILAAALVWAAYTFYAPERGSDTWARKVFGTSLYMPIAFLVASGVSLVL